MRRLVAVVLVAALAACAKPAPAGEIRISGSAVQGGLLFGVAPPGTVSLHLGEIPVRTEGDGRFVVGFGRDAPSAVSLVAITRDGQVSRRTIAVRARTWNVESIPSLHRAETGPSSEYELIRGPEIKQIAAARAGDTGEIGWAQAFAWPAQGRVSGVYGSQRILGGVAGSPHYGVDIAAPPGTPVLAPAGGVVRLAQKFSLEGNMVMLDHGHGLVSVFLHLSAMDVVPGERVTRGQRLGRVGTTGRSTGPHLHWGMTWDAVKVDPQLLVPAMP